MIVVGDKLSCLENGYRNMTQTRSGGLTLTTASRAVVFAIVVGVVGVVISLLFVATQVFDDDTSERLTGDAGETIEASSTKNERQTVRRRVDSPTRKISAATKNASSSTFDSTSPDDDEARPSSPIVLVLVVDDEGSPVAGVRVALRDRLDSPLDLEAASTDNRGHARLALSQDQRLLPSRVWVGFAIPLRRSLDEDIEIDPDSPPTEPVILKLPPTGRLVVEVAKPDGMPYRGKGTVVMVDSGEHDVATSSPLIATGSPTSFPRRQQEELVDGRVVYRHVGLGRTFRLHTWAAEGSIFGAIATVHAGPTRRGEEVVARVVFEETHPVLVARMVDDVGTPIVERFVNIVLDRDGEVTPTPLGARRRRSAKTDGDGIVRLTIKRGSIPPTSKPLFGFLYAPGGATPRYGSKRLHRPLEPGETFIGDVVLRLPPVVAAGTVVDPRGRPIANARVVVSYVSESREIAPHYPDAWETTSGKSGRFRVRAKIDAEARPTTMLHLMVRGSFDFCRRDMIVSLGDMKIELTTKPAARLRAKVRTRNDIPVTLVRANIEQGRPDVPRLGTPIPRSGLFTRHGLEPGTYRVSFLLRNCNPVIREVTLLAGETSDLGEIVIGDEGARYFNLVVMNGKGEPIDGKVAYRAAGSSAKQRRIRFHHGGVRFVAPSSRLDIVVHAPGCRTAEMTNVASGTHVTLGALLRVEIHTGLSRLPVDHAVSINGSLRAKRRLHVGGFAPLMNASVESEKDIANQKKQLTN